MTDIEDGFGLLYIGLWHKFRLDVWVVAVLCVLHQVRQVLPDGDLIRQIVLHCGPHLLWGDLSEGWLDFDDLFALLCVHDVGELLRQGNDGLFRIPSGLHVGPRGVSVHELLRSLQL